MCNFKVGEKVVCISTILPQAYSRSVLPEKGEMYTIRGILEKEGNVGLVLEEIVNPVQKFKNGYGEEHFGIKFFRKLDYQFAEDVIKKICEEPVEAEDLTKYNNSE